MRLFIQRKESSITDTLIDSKYLGDSASIKTFKIAVITVNDHKLGFLFRSHQTDTIYLNGQTQQSIVVNVSKFLIL